MENLRELKGKQIARTQTIHEGIDGWVVPSQTTNKRYFVRKDLSCTCPDCQSRGVKCKHAFAVQYFLQKITHTKQGVKIETKRLTYPQAWKVYTESQKSEVNQFDALLKDLVESVEEPSYTFGRPSLSLREQVFCLIQKVYSQLSSRRAYSLFENNKVKGLIKKTPNYNAVNKLMNKKELTPILKNLIVLSSAPLKSVETKFAIDSSGFRTTRFNDYCREKHGERKKHFWLKCHIITGVKTNTISGVEITDEHSHDTTQFKPLVKSTAGNGFNIKEILADKAYSSRNNIALVSLIGGTPFIPFKANASTRSSKSLTWRKMFHYFQYNQEEFMKHYHLRSNAESTFNMIKAKFGDSLKSKNRTAQENELLCKILCHNIVVVIHETNELGIKTDFRKALSVKNICSNSINEK
jgi:transposase